MLNLQYEGNTEAEVMNFGKTIQILSSGMMKLEYKDAWWRETKDETVKEQRNRLWMTLIIIFKEFSIYSEG